VSFSAQSFYRRIVPKAVFWGCHRVSAGHSKADCGIHTAHHSLKEPRSAYGFSRSLLPFRPLRPDREYSQSWIEVGG